jgi:hypothetical protein
VTRREITRIADKDETAADADLEFMDLGLGTEWSANFTEAIR